MEVHFLHFFCLLFVFGISIGISIGIGIGTGLLFVEQGGLNILLHTPGEVDLLS